MRGREGAGALPRLAGRRTRAEMPGSGSADRTRQAMPLFPYQQGGGRPGSPGTGRADRMNGGILPIPQQQGGGTPGSAGHREFNPVASLQFNPECPAMPPEGPAMRPRPAGQALAMMGGNQGVEWAGGERAFCLLLAFIFSRRRRSKRLLSKALYRCPPALVPVRYSPPGRPQRGINRGLCADSTEWDTPRPRPGPSRPAPP